MSLITSQPFPQTSKCITLASLSAHSLQIPSMSCPAMITQVNRNAFVGMDLGVPASPLEPFTSMDPKDYVWGTPSAQQQQQLFHQFMQMAFFCHLAQTANSMVNGNHGQPQLPFFPFAFPPFPHVSGTQFPFNPVSPAVSGFQQPPSSTPCSASAPSPATQCQPQALLAPAPAPAAASNCMSSSSQDITGNPTPVSPPSTGSVTVSDQKEEPCPALGACEIDCDVIQRLLDDADICAGHDNIDQVMHGFDYMGSPSGSDGSTATGETLLSSGSDSPVSVSCQESLTLGAADDDLTLSDEDFDAVMKGMNSFSAHGDFSDFDLDDIMNIEEKTAEMSNTSAVADAQHATDRVVKKSKTPKVQGGISKVTSRTKTAGVAGVPADDALQSITEFLLN